MSIEKIKSLLKSLFIKKKAIKAFLFGSRARQKAGIHSDIDIIVIDNENLPYLKRLDKYYNDIVNLLHESVDLFVYNENEFKRMREGPFLHHAMKGSVILYE